MYIVGLTGGIASGKTEAAKYLEGLGAHCIDADAISRALTAQGAPLLAEIRNEFGDDVFDESGALNRAALGKIVFASPEKRRKLDAITHPTIQRAMLDEVEQSEQAGEKLVFLIVPLLYETGMDVLCDETWLVSTDPELQKERLMRRDGLSLEDAENRIQAQMPLDQKIARASVVIDNSRSIDRMYGELQGLYTQLNRRVSRME
ncbi:MAG: dephospho-CoA kinase [Clostridia bacterium]|nr:dephospho-CoA kinase [Clostridia bacterium]